MACALDLKAKLACIVLAALTLSACGLAADSPGPVVRKPVSYKELRYSTTVRQMFDFTCGGAAVATLLTHYLGRPTREVDVLDLFRKRYPDQSWKAIQDAGLSMEDLVWVANQLGFEAQPASISGPELEKVQGPVIVHLKNGELLHFSVLRARRGGRTYLSDPILGATSMTNDEFDKEYTGSAVAIWKTNSPLPQGTKIAHPAPIDERGAIQTIQGNPIDYFHFKSL